MKKNPCLILILLLISFVTNVSAANAPEDATLTVKMYNFYKGYPLEPELTYTGTIGNITYSYKRYNDASYSSNCSNLTKDQLLAKLKSESANNYHLQVSCTLNGTTTTATKDFWIVSYSNNVRDYGGPGTEETITTFSDLHLDVDRCVLKDAGGNIIIKLVKGGSGYYHLYVAPGVQLGNYELPIYQINTTSQICKLNVTVVPFKRDAGLPEYLPTLESALKVLYQFDNKTITITLLADYSGEETTFNIDDGHDYILNLNGHNMTGKFTFYIYKGSSLTINGDNDKTNLNANFVVDYDTEHGYTDPASLTINGGKYTTNENFCINNRDWESSITLNSGIFKSAKSVYNDITYSNTTCLNTTPGEETAFYVYEGDTKYFVGYNDDGHEVVVEKLDTWPFEVKYEFKKYFNDKPGYLHRSGTKKLHSFLSVAWYADWDDKYQALLEGTGQCKDIKATITLLCNYKNFGSENLTFTEDANITLDLKSKGFKMDATGNITLGGTAGLNTAGCTLTILADNNNTNLKGSCKVAYSSDCTIKGGTFKGTDYGLNVESGTATLYYGTFTGSTAAIHKSNNATVKLGDNRYYYDKPNSINMLDPQPKFDADGNLRATEKTVTVKKGLYAYAQLTDATTLTFKYDGFMPEENAWEISDDELYQVPGWRIPKIYDKVTKVVFDKSLKDNGFKPISCNEWFRYFKYLNTIDGIKNLSTDNVKVMTLMFCGCSALKDGALDLSHFNTSSVITMESMFYGCSGLESLDLSSFDTQNVENMGTMFYQCTKLKDINFGDYFSTKKCKSFSNMFGDCKSLTELDLSFFDNKSVSDDDGSYLLMNHMFLRCDNLKVVKFGENFKPFKYITNMFKDCPALETIIVDNDNWNATDFESVTTLFDGSSNLTGGNGTKYDEDNKANLDYFRIDSDDAPGYFTKLPYTIKCMDGETELYSTDYMPFDSDISFLSSPDISKDKITLPAPTITKPGYEFAGWSDGRNTNLTSVTKNVEIDPTKDRFNRVYIANWDPKPYTITFNSNGGSKYIDPITKDCDSDLSDIKALDPPTREGYEFAGWSPNIPDKMPPEDLTLTAQWKPKSYTITYNLDGGTMPDGYRTTYTLEDEFTLEEPQKNDFFFAGWLDANGKKVVSVAKGTIGNLEFTATWLPRIVAKLDDSFDFPSNFNKYCDGSEKSVAVNYQIITGVSTDYTVTFEGGKIPEISGTAANSGKIEIPIPEDLESGVYHGTVVFFDKNEAYGRSIDNAITINATIPEHLAIQVYTDVLVANNHGQRFEKYQWYKNDSELPGATLQFYSEPQFSGSYKVLLTGKEGSVMSCPLVFGGTAKILAQSVSVYPNPARSGETFTIEIAEYDPAQKYDIMIFSESGAFVQSFSGVEKSTSVTLPSGIYSGSLISAGKKTGFKFIVR